MWSAACLVALAAPISPYARTLAIRPGPTPIGPKSIGWPATVLTAPRMRSSLTASLKKSTPHCS